MAKLSAGIIAYRHFDKELQVLLVHPGGPFWKNKDEGAWSIPKGEYVETEDALTAAKREFFEETGNTLPDTNFISLPPVKTKNGKLITAWAVKADFAQPFISSNQFEMEWPPRSGKFAWFDETDKGAWFGYDVGVTKINKSLLPLLQAFFKLF